MQLAIDCADDAPAVALAVDGVAGLTAAWQTARNHSIELLPNIGRLLAEASRTKADIDAVFVDTGPGGYAALRAGVSVAKALAHALGVPLVGVGRLELDARSVSAEAGERRIVARRIVAVHRAGRGEVAWAAYRNDNGWREEAAPRITREEALLTALEPGDALAGDAALVDAARTNGVEVIALSPHAHRVAALAELGHQRLTANQTEDPTTLVPLYLRAPAIGPRPA